MKKRIISFFCTFAILFGCISGILPFISFAADSDTNSIIIKESEIPMKLWYEQEAEITSTENSQTAEAGGGADQAWERWSLPLGNGYFGANVFGRTETERIQITEKTLAHPFSYNPTSGGLNNFSETYIDFGHTGSEVADYIRYIDIKTAISGVEYTYGGVKYTREYFTSYPDKALVIRLDADTEGALSFTLRPTIPYEQEHMYSETDGKSKTGTVTSSVTEDGVGYIELAEKMGYYDIDFLGIYKVYTDGELTAATVENNYTDITGTAHSDVDGTIKVSGASSAYIVVTLGTDYEICSDTFDNSATKPTQTKTLEDTRAKVESEMKAIDDKISGKSIDEAYALLKETHVADHAELFGRVSADLNCDESDFSIPTDKLLENYKANGYGNYLETLLFQYGRYLLIASSRPGALPANLQGTWNTYNTAPWGSGYWHNINVQMNYWHAFSTNLAETFEAYVDYNNAYMKQAETFASANIGQYNPSMYDKDGGNGWVVGVGQHMFTMANDRSAGNLGFTTQMFWDYYQFTKDPAILQHVYDVLVNAARYITKCVELDADGNYLVSYCDSPEVHVNGIWYYTKGTTYAQTFAYLNNYNALAAAKELGIDITDAAVLSGEEYSILKTVLEQIDKYDPIHVGLSGQIKEFREEDYYSSVGDDPNHRHVSQLVGLYPGDLINATTPAWLDAAKVTLEKRKGGNTSTGGWVYSHKSGLYARVKDGEMAHSMVSGLLKQSTFPNLFTKLWAIFQIDSSFGITAGIGEMLLQSHEGYIEPLAALPEAWSSGSYTGLVARGNFEISAAWCDGVATTFNIKSNAGERASVYYPTITGANVVRASDGKNVDYTVSGKDLITFDTTAGETYIISGFKAVEVPDAPAALNYTRVGFGEFKLNWSKSENAVKYNVYVAVDNAPDYTLVATTTATGAKYQPTSENENTRTTFAVTAINADGTESERTLCYYNPEDTSTSVEEFSANITKELELQVIVKADGNTIKYRLYEMASGESEYTLIDESAFPLLYTANYNSTSKYALSVISYYNAEESELVEIKSFANAPLQFNAQNILLGKTFVQESGTRYDAMGGFGYNKLTDGIIDTVNSGNGRFSSCKSSDTVVKSAAATVDLGGTYILSEIVFHSYVLDYMWKHFGYNFTLEVYSEGKWVPIVSNLSNEELLADYIESSRTDKGQFALRFDLNCIKASKIRFSSDAFSGTTVTLYEIECAGILIDDKYAYSDNVLLGKEFIGTEPTIYSAGAGGDVFTYDKLTDGVISSDWKLGRYSSVQNGKINCTLDLGGIYRLDELRLYDYNQLIENAGQNLKIDVLSNGKWITKAYVEANADFANYRVTESTDVGGAWFAFDLGGVEASKIRITGDAVNGKYITYYEIECSGTLLYKFGEYSSNILSGKEFVPAENTTVFNSSYGYNCLTDGIFAEGNGRFSSAANSFAEATLDLGGEYYLSEIRFYDFVRDTSYSISSPTHAGDKFTLEVLSDGVWVTIAQYETVNELQAHRVKTGTKGAGQGWLAFDTCNIKAEKIRFYAKGASATNGYVTYYEIECSAFAADGETLENPGSNALKDADATIGNAFPAEENILDGKTFVPTDAALAAVYNSSFGYAKLTDRSYNSNSGRFSSKQNGMFDATVDLGEAYDLSTLRISFFNGNSAYVGSSLEILVYADGEWTSVIKCASNADIMNYYTLKGSQANDKWLVFDLDGAKTEKLRISIPGTTSNGYVSFYEIECSGTESSKGKPTEIKSPALAIDGSLDTYTQVANSPSYALTFDLGVPKVLYSLKIYELVEANNLVNGVLATASDDTSVEIYRDGVWVRIADGISLDPTALYSEINLYGTECSKVRVVFNNTRTFDGESERRAANISEVTCTTGHIPVSLGAMAELLEKLPVADTTADPNNRYLYNDIYDKFNSYIAAENPSADEIAAYVDDIGAYYEAISSTVLSAYNISLGGDISLNFRYKVVNAAKLATFPDAYVEFRVPSPSGIKLTKVYLKDAPIDSDGRYIFSVEVAAAQLTDDITLYMVYDENTIGASYTTSVRDYVDYVLANGEEMEVGYPGVCNLLRAMVNYGAYAQNYFGYNTDNLANSGIYSSANDPVQIGTLSENASVSVSGSIEGIKCSGWKISLLSKTTLKVYFTLSNAAISGYDITVIDPDGKEVEMTAIADGARYRIDIENIEAKHLDDNYTIKIKRIADNSEYSVSISVMCYVSAMKTSADTNMVNLVHALKLYSDAANAYFERN